MFDSVIVVTDWRILDDQIQKTIKGFMQVRATVGHAERSGDLRKFIQEGKKIIVSTVQKFPFILDEIALDAGKCFAIIIDEAHSSQGGKTSAAMSEALGGSIAGEDDGPDPEDTVNDAIEKRMAARKMLTNASYFAFTATPKNKTLEMFGEPLPPDAEGKVKHRPFHSYTMKQAIEEGFILDVLKAYIPVDSYYKLVKKTAAMKIALADEGAEIEPVPTDARGHKPEPELDRLSNILKTFNEQFGTLFTDTDRVAKRIRDDIAPKVAANAAYQNAKENTPHTARMAHDQALAKVMQHLLKDDTQVYKQFVENESFKRFVGDMVYAITNP